MITFTYKTLDDKISAQIEVNSDELEDAVAAFECFLYAAGFNFKGMRLDFVPEEVYENGWIQPMDNEVN